MTPVEEDDMYAKIKDIHKMVKDIWISLIEGDPKDDIKDFTLNILANLFANKVESKGLNKTY
jgi:hypothetical protein